MTGMFQVEMMGSKYAVISLPIWSSWQLARILIMSTPRITPPPPLLTGTSKRITYAGFIVRCEELRSLPRTGRREYDVVLWGSVFQMYQINKRLMVEWEFINNLSYRSQLSEEQSHFVKLIYRTKLKKVSPRFKSSLRSWRIGYSRSRNCSSS